jgi:hypothetical protein
MHVHHRRQKHVQDDELGSEPVDVGEHDREMADRWKVR